MNAIRCIWLWGPTGCGKNKWIYEHFKNVYPKNWSSWWDLYKGEEVVTFDNMMPGTKIVPSILNWVKRSEHGLRSKHGIVTAKFKWFFITSVYSLDECLKGSKYLKEMRDIFEVYHFDAIDNLTIN